MELSEDGTLWLIGWFETGGCLACGLGCLSKLLLLPWFLEHIVEQVGQESDQHQKNQTQIHDGYYYDHIHPHSYHNYTLQIINKSEVFLKWVVWEWFIKIDCNKMLILIVLLSAHLVHPHLIIDITPSNNQVNANQQIAIKILTNSTVSSNALMLNFTTDFTLNNPCLVNSSTSTCTYAMSTSAVTVTFPNAFAANTYYVLTVTVINPNFATNFPLSASVGGVPFTNSGIVTIIAKTITCAMGLSSSYVGDTSIGYFTLSNDALPSNSIITINSSQQTTFSNLFQSNPTCSFGSSNAACTLSSSFGSQYLTINNVPTNANLKLNVSFVNNPPFNSSLMAINLLIQNVDSYNMQVCSFQQATPTLLRTSLAATLQNWNSSVGSSSNVTLTISSYFTPFTTNLLFIYDSNFSINSISPSQTSSAFIQGNSTYLYLSNGVTVGKSLTFTISVRNPSTQQPVNFTFYVIYSNTQFV